MNTNTELTPITQTIAMEKTLALRENPGSSVSSASILRRLPPIIRNPVSRN
jgi:hypothetical protein